LSRLAYSQALLTENYKWEERYRGETSAATEGSTYKAPEVPKPKKVPGGIQYPLLRMFEAERILGHVVLNEEGEKAISKTPLNLDSTSIDGNILSLSIAPAESKIDTLRNTLGVAAWIRGLSFDEGAEVEEWICKALEEREREQ